MDKPETNKYWLDIVTNDIIKRYPKGEIIVSSGISPSGPYHVGHFREVLTADAIAWSLAQIGRQVQHLHFVDDFDALRKIPTGSPIDFQQHLGKPLYLVPDPEGCHESYADHHFQAFADSVAAAGIRMKVLRSHKEYQGDRFTDCIEKSLERIDQVKKIFADVAGRQVGSDWAPVQLLSDEGRLDQWQYVGLDKAKQTVRYRDEEGAEGEISLTKGQVKLDWRLDWAARWSIWQVQLEPFGRDHATRGGSYDTGKELCRQLFDWESPYPVPYDDIRLAGQTKKMSASAGNVVTPSEALEVMPPEILRYFVLKSRPAKVLSFDSGLGLYNLIEEYSKVERAIKDGQKTAFEQAYQVATAGADKQTIASIPFSHLVSVYQAAQGKFDAILDILERTGYSGVVKEEKAILEREVAYVKSWLSKYAPESVKFSVQPKPKAELSPKQKDFLQTLATGIENQRDLDGQAMHELIYSTKDLTGIEPADAFKAIYRVILGQDSGPKAGWFLASLDHDWLIKRLRLLE